MYVVTDLHYDTIAGFSQLYSHFACCVAIFSQFPAIPAPDSVTVLGTLPSYLNFSDFGGLSCVDLRLSRSSSSSTSQSVTVGFVEPACGRNKQKIDTSNCHI